MILRCFLLFINMLLKIKHSGYGFNNWAKFGGCSRWRYVIIQKISTLYNVLQVVYT